MNFPAIQRQLFRASLELAQFNVTKYVVCKSTARWRPNLWKNFKIQETSMNFIQAKHVVPYYSSWKIQNHPQHPPDPHRSTTGHYKKNSAIWGQKCIVIFLISTSSWGLVANPMQCALQCCMRFKFIFRFCNAY